MVCPSMDQTVGRAVADDVKFQAKAFVEKQK